MQPQDKEELRREFQSKTVAVSKDPAANEVFDGQFLWVKQGDGTKLLKVMEGGKLKQLYTDADSQIFIYD